MSNPIEGLAELAGKYTRLMIAGEAYGIKTDRIKSVEHMPKIRKVPKAPLFIEGVANIGGRIIPIINPFVRLDLPEITKTGSQSKDLAGHATKQKPGAKQTLVLVQQDDILYGIMVDEITSIENISADLIEPVNPLMIQKDAPYIGAMAKMADGLIYLLDLSAVILSGVTIKKEDEQSYHDFSRHLNEILKPRQQKSAERYLAFTISEESYALHVSAIKEVSLADGLKSLKSGPEYIAGVKELSGRALPVMDLANKLDMKTLPYSQKSRIVWVEVNTQMVGIIVNSIDALFAIERKEIKDPPQNIVKNSTHHIMAIAMLDDGRQMLSILNKNHILTADEMAEFKQIKEVQMEAPKAKSAKKVKKKTTDLLAFYVADMELAVFTKDVAEVILMQDMKKMPKVPDHIKGVVSVKGDLIPIVDLYQRFDLERSERKQKSRIVLMKTAKSHFGIEVDAISDIINVDDKSILPADKVTQHIDKTFVDSVAAIKDSDRSPIILNVDNLY